MVKLKELIHFKTLEKLFIPSYSLYETGTLELKHHPIELRKEKGGQTITVEFNKKSLRDLKRLFSIEEKFV